MSVTRFIDPDATIEVEVGGVKFTIGYWPAVKAEQIGLTLAKLRRVGEVDLKKADPERAFAAIGLNREVAEDAVRYGVRGWVWEGAKPAKVVDGVLSQSGVDALRLSGIIWDVSFKCMDYNMLSDTEKKS